MTEFSTNDNSSEQVTPDQTTQVEVVIDGKVYKKTILPAVKREDSLGKKGGVKRMPPKSRELTLQEETAIKETRREERTIYDRKFSESGRTSDGAPQGDIAWDGSSTVNGAYTPDNYYLNDDERHEQQ